jgi:hypothetical protein
LSGRGSLEAADLGGEGGKAMTTTTIREEMKTLTTSDSVRPAHITINLWDKEKGGPFGQGEEGGAATADVNLQGRVGDAANEKKIWTTAMEKEKERVRVRATRRTTVARGGAGVKTTTTEVAVDGGNGRRRLSGQRSPDNSDDGNNGDGDNNDLIERL